MVTIRCVAAVSRTPDPGSDAVTPEENLMMTTNALFEFAGGKMRLTSQIP